MLPEPVPITEIPLVGISPLDKEYKVRIRNSIASLINAGYDIVVAQDGGNYTFVKRGA